MTADKNGYALLSDFTEASRTKYIKVGRGEPYDQSAYNTAWAALYQYIKRSESDGRAS
jgi:hypothetical protein